MAKDEDKKAEVFLYDLTKMTGRGSKGRRPVVVMTVEMRRGTLFALIFALFPTLAVGGTLAPLIGIWTLIPAVLTFMAAMTMILARQRRGLQLALWRGWADKRRSRTGVFIQCNRVIDPLQTDSRVIVHSSRPNTLLRVHDDEALTDEAFSL